MDLATLLLVYSDRDIAAIRCQMQASTAIQEMMRSADVANKRTCLMKQELLRRIDLFGKQLPLRLFAEVLSYSELRSWVALRRCAAGGG